MVQQRTPQQGAGAGSLISNANANTIALRDPLDPRARCLQWGTHARPKSRDAGLTVEDLNIGIYGHIPEHVETRSRMPRGAYPAIGLTDVGGYNVRDSYLLWSDEAAALYEEAISRRWSTATDLPWSTARGLPDDVELAICQVATELVTHAQTEIETISKWFQELNPIYHEIKLHLSTNVYDNARLFDGYRKRAMFNGGGMQLESPGWVNRLLFESMSGWTETVILMQLLRGVFTHTVLRYLSVYGPTELDRKLAYMSMVDKTRHIAYAVDHIRFSLSGKPERARTYSVALFGAEAQLVRDENDHVMWEALAIIFGGGIENIDAGMEIVKRLRRDWVNSYLDHLDTSGVNRRPFVVPGLKSWVEDPEAEVQAAGD